MGDSIELHDWELVPSSNLSDTPKVVEVVDEGTVGGPIKADYFSLDSGGFQRPRSEEESDGNGVDSDNPSWADPDSDSGFLETSRGQLGFVGNKFPVQNSGGFCSDESSDAQSSLANNEKMELDSLGESIMETGSETLDDKFDDLGKESEGEESSYSRKMITNNGNVSVIESENGRKIWWKRPLELLKFCFLRIRPVWSISIAAAVVGILMLGRKLRRMKHKSQSIQLKIAIDDKKTSEHMARSARLDEAFSVVRRIPIIRPSLPSSGASQWPLLPLR